MVARSAKVDETNTVTSRPFTMIARLHASHVEPEEATRRSRQTACQHPFPSTCTVFRAVVRIQSPQSPSTPCDRLLIELKEERSLPWKRIAEYFPGRSAGSLQVRYCTRLKGSKAGNSGRSGRNSNVTSGSSYRGTSCEAVQAAGASRQNTEGVARQRYGPPRRRQIVDRYSPV